MDRPSRRRRRLFVPPNQHVIDVHLDSHHIAVVVRQIFRYPISVQPKDESAELSQSFLFYPENIARKEQTVDGVYFIHGFLLLVHHQYQTYLPVCFYPADRFPTLRYTAMLNIYIYRRHTNNAITSIMHSVEKLISLLKHSNIQFGEQNRSISIYISNKKNQIKKALTRNKGKDEKHPQRRAHFAQTFHFSIIVRNLEEIICHINITIILFDLFIFSTVFHIISIHCN